MIPDFVKQLKTGDKVLIESDSYGIVDGVVQSQDRFTNSLEILGDFGYTSEFGSQATVQEFYYDDYGKSWKAYEIVQQKP